ncbi:MAG TPA: hypothetical protein VFD60_09750 [Nitrososphaeraceae archaeon]|jgi:hypothetical protein|nr:hypothetical protein [Nitrososphaeraceae archaeon]
MATTKIDGFEVVYSANGFVPRIWLKSGNKIIGQLVFQPDGTTLSAASIADSKVSIYYHLEDFPNIIDLLRNQKSMYLAYGGEKFENGIKTTPD